MTEKVLAASPKSGVAAGTYPVVSVIALPGDRIAYRAVVGDALFPIRQYGTAEETISKICAKGADRMGHRKSDEENGHEVGDIALTASADRILSELQRRLWRDPPHGAFVTHPARRGAVGERRDRDPPASPSIADATGCRLADHIWVLTFVEGGDNS